MVELKIIDNNKKNKIKILNLNPIKNLKNFKVKILQIMG